MTPENKSRTILSPEQEREAVVARATEVLRQDYDAIIRSFAMDVKRWLLEGELDSELSNSESVQEFLQMDVAWDTEWSRDSKKEKQACFVSAHGDEESVSLMVYLDLLDALQELGVTVEDEETVNEREGL